MSYSILRQYLEFNFDQINMLYYVDNFEFNDDWPYLQIYSDNKIITRGYNNKMPQIKRKLYQLSLFHKCRMYNLDCDKGIGDVIISGNDNITVPGLTIKNSSSKPYTSMYTFVFDFHIMMTVIATINDIMILENHQLALTRAFILYKSFKFEIVENRVIFTNYENHELLHELYILLHNEYKENYSKIKLLHDKLDKPDIDTSQTHFSLAYEVWFRGSRENQREWPYISNHKINIKSIEFPINSNCWYTPPENKFVGLSLRHDDNPLLYIPRLYKKNNPHLDLYLNNTIIEREFTIPKMVRKKITELNSIVSTKPYINYNGIDPAIILDISGKIIGIHYDAKVVVYNNFIISKLNNCDIILPKADAQLLDNNHNRVKFFHNNIWIDSSGPRILNIITIPWYYRQIIHDYNKLKRLRNGPLMDLMHIGIVELDNNDIITFPVDNIDDLYISDYFETHRLMTFKHKFNVYDSFKIASNLHNIIRDE